MIYTCWLSSTCFICRQDGGPRVHARLGGWEPTSPCDTTGTRVEARDRTEAIRLYKKRAHVRDLLGLPELVGRDLVGTYRRCCERDDAGDGDCDIHSSRGVPRERYTRSPT